MDIDGLEQGCSKLISNAQELLVLHQAIDIWN